MNRLATVLSLSCLVLLTACGGGGGSPNCSLKNPATLDERADQWPKFRRDRQNTGTVHLSALAYAALARDRPPVVETPVGTPAEDLTPQPTPTATASPLAFPGLERESSFDPFIASPVVVDQVQGNARHYRIYIGSSDGRLVALDENLRRLKAIDPEATLTPTDTPDPEASPTPTPIDFEISSVPLPFLGAGLIATRDEQHVVFIGAGNSFIYAVREDGAPVDKNWPRGVDTSAILASGTMTTDGVFFTNTLGVGFAGICPNGVPRFIFGGGPSESSPAVGRDLTDEELDETLYYGADDRRLRAVTRKGVLLWSTVFAAPILTAPIVQLDDAGTATQAIFAVDISGVLLKLGPDGRPLQTFETPEVASPVVASPALARSLPGSYCSHGGDGCDRLYAVFDDTIWAYDADNGEIRMKYDVGARVRTSPAVVLNADDPSDQPVLVFGADDGRLHFVRDDGEVAEEIGVFELPHSGSAVGAILSSPAVASDGTVYFGAPDGRVYAVR